MQQKQFKGTPGPWIINHWSGGPPGIVSVKKKDGISYFTGDAVGESFYGIRSEIGPDRHNIQASFEGAHIAKVIAFSEESEANAKAIAAVPDLIKALQELLRFEAEMKLVMVEKLQYPDNFLLAVDGARAALDKAL